MSTSHSIEGDYPTTATYSPASPSDAVLLLAHGAGAGQHHTFMVGIAEACRGARVDVGDVRLFLRTRAPQGARSAPVLDPPSNTPRVDPREGGARDRRLLHRRQVDGGRMATHLGARGVPASRHRGAGLSPAPARKTGNERAAHLQAIKVPLLIVQGTRDAFGSPDDLAWSS